MTRSSTASPEESFILADGADRYFCPVCGTGLARSDFDTPSKHYYCPYCSTRQTPSLVGPRVLVPRKTR
jgi:DNA-directed RNA polymerase subunit RPC12/RpoP